RFQVQCDARHVENHLRTVKKQWQIIYKIRGESGFGWDDNMKMITCDRATYDAAVMAHKKYEPFLNKSIDHYDEMALVVGKDMATGTFVRTFADIDLDDDPNIKEKMFKKVSLMNKLNLWVNNLAKLLMLWNNLLRTRHHSFTNKRCRWRKKDLMMTSCVLCLII
ncbi:hypothetical protein Gotur_022335, partial [Gossypium turneri]